MYDFNLIIKLNKNIKKVLEDDFKLVYVEKRIIFQGNNKKESLDDLSYFKIEKNKKSIFDEIKSIDSLNELKNKIKNLYEEFNQDFEDYFDRVENQLDENHIKSFESINKIIKNRGKKLNTTINKFKIEDNWNSVSKIKEEFYFKLQKNIKDILESLLPTISVGLKDNSAYEGVLICLNNFLSKLGIYTEDVQVGDECNYDLLDPQECDDCKTNNEQLKDIIKEVLSYPYLLNNENGDILLEGNVILWKVVSNG